jgi:uncharacterized protein (TIGR03790 family)
MKKIIVPLLLLLLAPIARAELGPENLLLLVNKKVPDSQKLADYYAKARGVPAGRVLALDMPIGDEISFGAYESEVVPAVRDFLRTSDLERKVTCIVTFFGTPLRIAQHKLSPEEAKEIASLKQEQAQLASHLRGVVSSLEEELKQSDPSFTPQLGDDIAHVVARADVAMKGLYQRIGHITDVKERGERLKGFVNVLHDLMGPAGVLRAFNPENDPKQGPEQKAKYEEALAQVKAAAAEISQLQDRRFDPAARALLRKLVGERFGKLEQLRITEAQIEYLTPENTTASFDNELALLWLPAYGRPGWVPNPMHFTSPMAGKPTPLVMVMRLDAPQSGMVRDMIIGSLKAEREGLKGRLVLDSRGIAANGDAGKFGQYGWYDQSIRDLAKLVSTKTKVSVLHEDSDALLPPNAASGVALYCGWYSVRNYVPSCKFVPGAVAFHVASFELVDLKMEGEKGWCRGLLSDGAAATLGPVSEPYLVAFPPADDFFPLLLTGKLPLAEVYWKTTPFTSWMISMIGDPLYTPYKVNPALKVEDLPARLKTVFETPTTRPAEETTKAPTH